MAGVRACPRTLGEAAPRGDVGQPLTCMLSCAAETRGPLRGAPGRGPAHAIHRESCVPLAAGAGGGGPSGLGHPWWPAPCACRDLGAFSSPGQPVRHRDRRQHRLRGQAHRHQLHHLPRQQQGPAAHLGEHPARPVRPRRPLRLRGPLPHAQGERPARPARPRRPLRLRGPLPHVQGCPSQPACCSLSGPVHTRGLTHPDVTAPTAGADPFT